METILNWIATLAILGFFTGVAVMTVTATISGVRRLVNLLRPKA